MESRVAVVVAVTLTLQLLVVLVLLAKAMMVVLEPMTLVRLVVEVAAVVVQAQ
jgi:hypothetical protein